MQLHVQCREKRHDVRGACQMTEINETLPPTRTRPTIKQLLAEQDEKKAASARARRRTQRVLEILSQVGKALYALLDTARDARILPLLTSGGCEYRILYNGKTAETMAGYAPYLVSLPPEAPFLEQLVERGWGQSWGYYLSCSDDFSTLRNHFRRLTMVKMPDGTMVYFRFYDPRVLRAFLPTAVSGEIDQFFGAISAFYLEAEDGNTLLTYTRAREATHETGLVQQSTPLTEGHTE